MTNPRQISKVRGFVHDIDHVKTLSVIPSNARVLSDRVLYILQNLALEDISFFNRYGTILGATYEPVEPTSTDGQIVENVVSLVRDELNTMTLEQTLECICEKLSAIAVISAQDCGSNVDAEEEPTPPIPGPDWPTQPSYDVYKCKAANWIMDGLDEIFLAFKLYDVAFWTSTTFSVVVGLVSAVILASVLTGFVGIVAGAVIAIATKLVTGAALIDLVDISSVLATDRVDFICALYGGTDTGESLSNFEAVAASSGLNSTEVSLLALILTNSTLNNLFEFSQTISDYTATTSCATCCQSVLVYWGTLDSVSGDTYTISSEQIAGGDWFVDLGVNVMPGAPEWDECGPEMEIEMFSIAGFTEPVGGDDNVAVWEDPDYTLLYSFDGVPPVPQTWDARRFWAKSGTDWTLVMKINQL